MAAQPLVRVVKEMQLEGTPSKEEVGRLLKRIPQVNVLLGKGILRGPEFGHKTMSQGSSVMADGRPRIVVIQNLCQMLYLERKDRRTTLNAMSELDDWIGWHDGVEKMRESGQQITGAPFKSGR